MTTDYMTPRMIDAPSRLSVIAPYARASEVFPHGSTLTTDARKLWLVGNEAALSGRPFVAIVGARACSQYGRTVARSWSQALAAAGCAIVSGMARGIDGEAHRGTLDAGGVTIAVLGCGVDRAYPAAHAELYRRIADNRGAIVSEWAPGVEPAPWRFPMRNRIIAALADVLVVVEARERSGSLIAADFAREYGRPVLVVPGEVTSGTCKGSNRYAVDHDGDGARFVLTPDDVLEALQ